VHVTATFPNSKRRGAAGRARAVNNAPNPSDSSLAAPSISGLSPVLLKVCTNL